MASMSSFSQFRNLSLRVFIIRKGAGHSGLFASRSRPYPKTSPTKEAGSPLTSNCTQQGDCSHCVLPYNFNQPQFKTLGILMYLIQNTEREGKKSSIIGRHCKSPENKCMFWAYPEECLHQGHKFNGYWAQNILSTGQSGVRSRE